ncbi:MAG TPA: phage tail protein [Reyranella sp.]|nr:phage tail protein [Reyranella sp.]
MNGLQITADLSQFARLGNMLGAAGGKAPLALARAVNHTGAKAKTAMTRALPQQTGLKPRTIRKALHSRQMWPGRSGRYAISSSGGDVRLKFFGARETAKGVSAAPWRKRRLYRGAFIKGGLPEHRVPLNMGRHVFRRVGGAKRLPIEPVRSGLYIPREMVSGESQAAFYGVVSRDLPNRLGHELGRLLGGAGGR